MDVVVGRKEEANGGLGFRRPPLRFACSGNTPADQPEDAMAGIQTFSNIRVLRTCTSPASFLSELPENVLFQSESKPRKTRGVENRRASTGGACQVTELWDPDSEAQAVESVAG